LRHAGAHAAAAANDEGYFGCAHLLLRKNATGDRSDQNATAYTIIRGFAGRHHFPKRTIRLRLSAIDILGPCNSVDVLQRLEQAQAGIGFPEPIKMHVWFDHANVNGYDSYPLQMLTFSLHRIRLRPPGESPTQPCSLFSSFRKSP
jgi:hypothetical protein